MTTTSNAIPGPIRATQFVGFVLMVILAIGVAGVSTRFFAPNPPMAEAMQSHLDARPIAFLTHVGGGIIALLVGAVQFVTRQGPRRKWHAAAGRIYVLACLGSGLAGLVIAWHSTAGPVATAGFSGLAVAWIVSTAMGFQTVIGGRIAAHRRWMIRSYALTLAAVTLRIMLPLVPVLGIDFTTGYLAISFLCWIPNLLAAELWIAATSSARLPGVPPRI